MYFDASRKIIASKIVVISKYNHIERIQWNEREL